MIYEIINPSDMITFRADDEKIAIVLTVLLGNGQYGLKSEADKNYPTLFLFMKTEQINEGLKPFFNSVAELLQYATDHAEEMAISFDSVVTADRCWRIDYEKALEHIVDEKERQKYKDEFNDRHASSLNNIYGCAQANKVRFQKLHENQLLQ